MQACSSGLRDRIRQRISRATLSRSSTWSAIQVSYHPEGDFVKWSNLSLVGVGIRDTEKADFSDPAWRTLSFKTYSALRTASCKTPSWLEVLRYGSVLNGGRGKHRWKHESQIDEGGEVENRPGSISCHTYILPNFIKVFNKSVRQYAT